MAARRSVTTTTPLAEMAGTWLLTSAAIFAASTIVPGFAVKDFTHAGLAAIMLGLVNAFARPTFSYFAAPITGLSYTLGLFIVNAALIWVAGTHCRLLVGVPPNRER